MVGGIGWPNLCHRRTVGMHEWASSDKPKLQYLHEMGQQQDIQKSNPCEDPVLWVSQKPETWNHTTFTTEDVWTEGYTVGHMVTHYSFHNVFYALFCFFLFLFLSLLRKQACFMAFHMIHVPVPS